MRFQSPEVGVCEAVRHEDGGFEGEGRWHGGLSKETRASIRDRGTRLFHLQLPRSGFGLTHSILRPSTVGCKPAWCGVGWRAGAHLSRYPVTCSLSESRVAAFGQSSLVLVCFWSATHRLAAGVRALLGVSCRCQWPCYVVTSGRYRDGTNERTLRSLVS